MNTESSRPDVRSSKWLNFVKAPLLEKWDLSRSFYWYLVTRWLYRPQFGSVGKRARIIAPLKLTNVRFMHLGPFVLIHRHAWLFASRLPNRPEPKLTIGSETIVGHFSHITCVNEVTIGSKVLIADKVHISDNSHGYADVTKPVMDQPVVSKGPVSIGDGSWIGENVSILSCRIGRQCVIGANAVVVRDIPDMCVAVGAPARVIAKYSVSTGLWERTGCGN